MIWGKESIWFVLLGLFICDLCNPINCLKERIRIRHLVFSDLDGYHQTAFSDSTS